jgi:hypothetical protein
MSICPAWCLKLSGSRADAATQEGEGKAMLAMMAAFCSELEYRFSLLLLGCKSINTHS